jgi:hypothetical protein
MQTIGNPRILRRALTLKTGQTTSYATGDDGDLEIGENHNYEILTTGQYSGTTNIVLGTVPKTDIHSNACVKDWSTGLMWTRTVSASVGPTSNGLLPFTPNANGESIFAYAVAANLALLAGYGNDPDPKKNWRVPTIKELQMLEDYEAPLAVPDATAFPVGWVITAWSSTTRPDNTANAFFVTFTNGSSATQTKITTFQTTLVRGPL